MSSFLSNKYLKFRRMLERGVPAIDTDTPCSACGYNLRTLQRGRNCPECGRAIPIDFERAADPLLAGDARRRSLTLWGLTLMTIAVLGVVVLRVVCAATMAIAEWPPLMVYASAKVILALLWSVGVALALPRALDLGNRVRASLRWMAIITQAMWSPSTILWLAAVTVGPFGPLQDAYVMWASAFGLIAMLGSVALAFVLIQVAEDVELDEAPRHIGMAIWTVPVLSVMLMFLPTRMYYFMLALVAPFLAAWAWYLLGFARGLWEMRRHVAWGMREATDVVDRAGRIAQTRAEMDRELAAQVRGLPVPPHAPPTSPQPRRLPREARH